MTDKTVTKTVRLPKEVAEYYGNKPIREVLQRVYTLIQENRMRFDDNGLKIVKTEEGVYTKGSDLAEIESMAKCCGTTLDNMLEGFRQMLEDDEIHCKNGFMYTDTCPFDYKDFIKVCKDKNVNPQEALDRFTKIMERE